MHSQQDELANNLKIFTTGLATKYLLSLNFIFAYLDYVYFSDLFNEFLILRFFVFSILALSNIYLKKSSTNKYVQLACSLPFFASTLITHYMIFRINDPMTPYWTNLVLILAAITVGFSFSWTSYLVNCFFIIAPFSSYAIYNYLNHSEPTYLLYPLFLGTMFLICLSGRLFYSRLLNLEFINRKKLNEEILNRNHIIEQKTRETLRLNSLSKQLSPQVHNAIKEERISFDGTTHRSEICALFVDIKNSTVKFSILDRDHLQKIISMYMEDVMGVMLKHDITIDKFLGDGVMGFTNDPVNQNDYLEKAITAATEILELIGSKSEAYKRYWGSDFEIRIGISSGYASIGFYGSDLHIKSYTAIGKVINLASRVNGASEANKISVSQDVVYKLKEKNPQFLRDFHVKDMGQTQLKGFEHEHIKIYEISKIAMDSKLSNNNCPFGHGLLINSRNENGQVIECCRYCDHQSSLKLIA